MASLYLVRHGQASFGTHDYDRLSGLGVRQAQQAGHYFDRVAGSTVRIACGSLVRQRDTAAEIARCLSVSRASPLPIEIDERFDEADLDAQIACLVPLLQQGDGTLTRLLSEARTSSRSYQKLVKRVFLHWQSLSEPLTALETWAAFSARTAAALQDLVRSGCAGETTIVVSSGAVIATLVRQILGLPPESAYALFEVMMNCSVTHLLHDRQRVSLSSFNECAYLAPTELLTYR